MIAQFMEIFKKIKKSPKIDLLFSFELAQTHQKENGL